MEKSSKYYNPDWPDYYCDTCGTLYQFYTDGNCSAHRHKPTLPERIKVVAPPPKQKDRPKIKNPRKKL